MISARYLVTGGAGFIGSHIAEALLRKGESVRILDNFVGAQSHNLELLRSLPGQLEIVKGDIRVADVVNKAMAGIEVVFHQAALASVSASISNPTLALEINVNGTHNILLAAREERVRRVVFASSSAIYGNTPALPKQEDMLPAPLSPYAIHKLTGEYFCKVFNAIYGLETVALRYFNVFGPRQEPHSEYAAVIPRFLTTLLHHQRPIVFGDGEQTRDFVYIENVVEANLLAATVPGAAGAVVNIGGGERISLNAVLNIACELLGTHCKADYQPARQGDVHDSLADIHKAQELLGYTPQISFVEGLGRTLKALQSGEM